MFTDTGYASVSSGSSLYGSDLGETHTDAESGSGDQQEQVRQDLTDADLPEKNNTICVFVCGAVCCEGVYELPESAKRRWHHSAISFLINNTFPEQR